MGLLPEKMDILPPYDDRIFKLILTSPDSKPILSDLISALIGRKVVDAVVRNNELPPQDTQEKAERFDVNCVTEDSTQLDIEMHASPMEEDPAEDGEDNKHENLKGKYTYYVCDLHSSQSAKGVKRYDRLAQSYQITFCKYTIFPEKADFVHSFSLRHDRDNDLLCDAVHIIFVELSKLKEVMKKPVSDMTDLEKWAIFFRYAGSSRHRETVNEVIASKEELQMAGELLMSISQDERERAVFRSRRMYETDYLSNMATAEDRGRRKGRREGMRAGRREGMREGMQQGLQQGLQQGVQQGLQQGVQQGERDAKMDVARKLLKYNRPTEEIVEITGLSQEEIERL